MLPKLLHTPRDLRRLGGAIFAAAAFACFAPAVLSAQATSQLVTNRLTQPIEDSARVTLKGTVHPLANKANDRGAAPESMPLDRIQVVLKRSDTQESALKTLITQMHTPGTASYHKWLTPEQFGQQFGPSDQDVATLEAWLQAKGFSVTKVNPGKQTLEIAGNVSQFRAAFNTQIRKYSVNGETHYANANDPQIPVALAPVFGGFASLNNFRPRRQSQVMGQASYDTKTGKAIPHWTYGTNSGFTFPLSPGDYALQYDLAPLYAAGVNGTGQTIAVVNDSNINIGMVNQFRTLFGLSANPPQVIIDGNDPGIDGTNNPDGPNGDSSEAYLDVEWSGAVAPNATIDLVIGADTALESGLILAAQHAVYGNIAPVISLSFGACESRLGNFNQTLNLLWEQAAAQGITVVVSSGDNGSAGCDNDDTQYYAVNGLGVSGYASTPYNVAVGGTDFFYSDYNNSTALSAQLATYWTETPSQTPATSLLQVIPEQPWNNSQYGLNAVDFYTDISGSTATSMAGGSGGASSCAIATYNTDGSTASCTGGYPKPAWQSGTGVPADSVRDIPDLSLYAANGLNYSYYPVCAVDGDCQPASGSNLIQITGIGGTSASAPSFAGIMALVNGLYGRQGQADFVLYPLKAQFSGAFHDVTNGTNSVPCEFLPSATPNCIKVASPITVTDPNLGQAQEGQIGNGTAALYNAAAGYNLATGLGTLDANVLVTNWTKVNFNSSGVTLTAPTAGTTITHGTAVTFTGTVSATSGSGTPTGDVAIETDSTTPIQGGQTHFALSNGSFSGSYSLLPGGTYNVWANYGGDTKNAGSSSSSSPTSITVNPEGSGIFYNGITPGGTITPGNNVGNIDYGTQIALSAQIAPSSQLSAFEACENRTSSTCPSFTVPTGTVAFTDGSTAINTAVLNAEGDAEYNAPFAIGAHTVTASYSGDASYNKSTTSQPLTFTVVKDLPAINLSAANQTSSGSYITGQPTVFNVQVINGAAVNNATSTAVFPSPVAPPTGTVTVSGFPSGTSAVGSLATAVEPTTRGVEAVATLTAPAGTKAGTYNVTVNYSGDSNYSATSGSGSITVVSTSGLTSTTTATVSGSVSPTTSIAISGTVTGKSGNAAPTGGILVYSSGNVITEIGVSPGSSDVSTFSYTLNSQNLFQGTNLITLQYTGDNTYAPSAFQLTNPISSPLSDFSMVPETTIVPVAVGASGTDTVNVSSVNGFIGAANFTCTPASGITCTITSAATLTSGSTSPLTLTVNAGSSAPNGTYNVLVTGTDSTGKFVHTLAISAVVTGSSSTASFTLTPSPATIPAITTGSSGTSAITVAPTNGFLGTVNLTCSVTGPTGATDPTCALVAASVDITGTAGIVSTLTVTAGATVTPGAYTVTVSGASSGLTENTTVSVTVNNPANANYTLTGSSAAAIASPGGSTTSTITVTPTNGFTGTVALSCAVTTSPSGAVNLPGCSLSPTSTATTSVMTVTTTAATSSALDRPLNKFFAVGGSIAVAGLLFFGIPARRRNWRTMLGVLVFAAIVGMGIGCGGSSGGGGGGGNSGTTTGNYVITVTGASGSLAAQTTTVNVTVN